MEKNFWVKMEKEFYRPMYMYIGLNFREMGQWRKRRQWQYPEPKTRKDWCQRYPRLLSRRHLDWKGKTNNEG